LATVQVRLELGRPLGAPRLGQVEKFRLKLLSFCARPQSNYQKLLTSSSQGALLPKEYWDIRVLTVCLEADLEPQKVAAFLKAVVQAAQDLELYLSINILLDPRLLPELKLLLEEEWVIGPRAKINLGLAFYQ
jgi:hypothetical protein